MREYTVTQREGTDMGPIDWNHDDLAETEMWRKFHKISLDTLKDAEANPDAYQATNDGGWPRIGWHRVICVRMYDSWPYWTPKPQRCVAWNMEAAKDARIRNASVVPMIVIELDTDDPSTQRRRQETVPGPWLEEKDVMLWVDPESGLPCLALRNASFCWCGYVGVPFGGTMDSCNTDAMKVHGGVNYAWRSMVSKIPLTWAAALPGVDWDNTRWIGFDCSHHMDLSPPRIDDDSMFFRDVVYRTREFVIEQTGLLARQIKAAG